jgi:hypothetical protein
VRAWSKLVLGAIALLLAECFPVFRVCLVWGLPGCGKTTIARLLAEQTNLAFEPLSAMFCVADLRKVFQKAQRRREVGQGTRLSRPLKLKDQTVFCMTSTLQEPRVLQPPLGTAKFYAAPCLLDLPCHRRREGTLSSQGFLRAVAGRVRRPVPAPLPPSQGRAPAPLQVGSGTSISTRAEQQPRHHQRPSWR